ncbi:MAG: sensor histidine kinase, partial [Actinomycetota bacterium]
MRTTAAAVLVVGIALIIGAIAMVITLRSSLRRDVEAAARLRASDVVTAIEGGTDPGTLALGDDDDSFVQVVNASGEVLASSSRLTGTPPMARLSPGDSLEVEGVPTEEDDPFMVVAKAADTGNDRFTVLVGRTLDPVEESGAAVGRILLFGIPLLLVVVAFTTWGVVGRALRWVESIRSQVAEISGSELHRRVPDPPGKDEIARLAGTMNSMLDRLEDDQKRSRRFVSDASHELRSPVATIRNQAEVALAHPHRGGLEELAEGVLAEDLRLERLVDDLLALAGNDETRVRAELPVDLDDMVLEEAKRIRSTTSLNVTSGGVSGGRTMGDASQLRRMVRNLADNAAQHAASAVMFSLVEKDGWVVLLVDDDGPGIPVDQRETVFQRFTRLDDARDRERGGAGLGLAIVKETIRRHNGTVEVMRAPIGGAR